MAVWDGQFAQRRKPEHATVLMNFGAIKSRPPTLRVSSRFKSGNPPNALLTYVEAIQF
ncbi:hypothetical protein NUACC21_25330 [Scytonema sp. NUACC21]